LNYFSQHQAERQKKTKKQFPYFEIFVLRQKKTLARPSVHDRNGAIKVTIKWTIFYADHPFQIRHCRQAG
jgi:hypothetical protein